MPNGIAVHNIQGLNLPHLEFVLSAIAPTIGLNPKAAIVPTVNIMAVASLASKP